MYQAFFSPLEPKKQRSKTKNKNKITPDLRLTLGRKFDITHWFSCGADGLAYGHVITKISRVDRLPNLALLARGAPLITRVRTHTSSL